MQGNENVLPMTHGDKDMGMYNMRDWLVVI